MCIEYHISVNMYHVSAEGDDTRATNAHYYYYYYYYYIIIIIIIIKTEPGKIVL